MRMINAIRDLRVTHHETKPGVLSYAFRLSAFFCFLCIVSCRTTRHYTTSVTTDQSYHSSYDDTTLNATSSSVLMPYNRFIDPAGTIIRFGNKALENHSLDCALLPGDRVLAVEDRFGLAFVDVITNQLVFHLDYAAEGPYKGFISTYSGVKIWDDGTTAHVFWGASNIKTKKSFILEALWNGSKASFGSAVPFEPNGLSTLALPNDIALAKEGEETFLYAVLNGNNQLCKIRLKDKKTVWTSTTGMSPFGLAIASGKVYVSNWAGSVPDNSSTKETAGIPYGKVYIDPRTGATSSGTVSVFDRQTGNIQNEVQVGLHPNDVIASPDQQFVYVANANSDYVSVIRTANDQVVDSVSVQLNSKAASFTGDSPIALAIDQTGTTLYVANGMDNAIAVVKLGEKASMAGKGDSGIEGFIPSEAYPAGLALSANGILCVANLEGEGPRVGTNGTYNTHRQEATISIIPLPDKNTLKSYSARVEQANLVFRTKLTQRLPRQTALPTPVPEMIGEPSSIKHIVYIIKENRTYDQILGDIPAGDGMKSLCIYGDSVTPNHHKLVKEFMLLDNYYVSGKSSAEGHQWTDAAIVTDYVERNVQAWFNSYPHVQTDAMVYNKKGFLWNNALDNGKSVKIYGEACTPVWDKNLKWKNIFQSYQDKKPFTFHNVTTISRVEPVLAKDYPCFDGDHNITDQLRADAFIKDLKAFEEMPGDQWPRLMIVALPMDHTAGTREGNPTPASMIADNDLALGRIIDAITHSRFYDSTAIFVTEDDSQGGWDHVSAYRTVGFVVSPYSRLQKTVHTNYNQTCIVRTIEQILGIPPMNVMDATALPMFDCFAGRFDKTPYTFAKNIIPLDEMNKPVAALTGKAKKFALVSASPQFDHVDGGDDDTLNRILWFAAMGNIKYPARMTIPAKKRSKDDDDDDDN